MTQRKNYGFTLIELMIVVVIIGVLVAIAIPVYSNTVLMTEKRACQANVRVINGAAAQYYMSYGIYPPTLSDLISPAYLLSMPHCPKTGTGVDYNYDPTKGIVTCTLAAHN